ncbi:hypothetical protein TK49_22690 (plasmid) [Ralstonia mannitolilytica]|nr:hypothetical protein TK49_22690 [Ralstonia mannitolilytica]
MQDDLLNFLAGPADRQLTQERTNISYLIDLVVAVGQSANRHIVRHAFDVGPQFADRFNNLALFTHDESFLC